MTTERKPSNYWTYEKCKEESLKYCSRTAFKFGSSGAYQASKRNKWINEIAGHMVRLGNRYNKCIYAYEFSDNNVYVGLTYNIEEREKLRNSNNKDAVTEHINKTGLKPNRLQLTEYVNVNKAIKLEEFYVNKYKDNGWNILNKAKTGGIGGKNIKWDLEACRKEALKYKSKIEFGEYNSSAYSLAKKHGWISLICTHMKRPTVYNLKYNINICQNEALKYTTRSDFNKFSHSIYVTCCTHKWLDIVCSHMIYILTPRSYWTKELCEIEAKKYKRRTEFKKYSNGAYKASLKNKWINDFYKKK